MEVRRITDKKWQRADSNDGCRSYRKLPRLSRKKKVQLQYRVHHHVPKSVTSFKSKIEKSGQFVLRSSQNIVLGLRKGTRMSPD